MLDQEDFFYLLLAGLVATIVYLYVLPNNADTHEMILENQASVGRVRAPGETAIYRSLVAPFGRPLMNGLAIGHNFSTRPGNLCDIWKIGSKAVKVLTAHSHATGMTIDELPNGMKKKYMGFGTSPQLTR